jgi:SAM-dependent methyltransferase
MSAQEFPDNVRLSARPLTEVAESIGQTRTPWSADGCEHPGSGAGPALARGTLVAQFATYHDFKRFLWERYVPLPEEVTDPLEGFAPGAHWAKRHAPRFYRALRAVEPWVRAEARLLDIGTYPGSFPRLARAAFGPTLRIAACGMPVTREFPGRLAADGITFRACDLDPMVRSPVELPPGVAPEELPVGLPFESDSVAIITCMEVIEHLFSLKTILTESARVLRPGGILYITTNNIMNRAGLVRIFRAGDTNLDDDLDQTTIWTDTTTPRRGHVRFYSIPLLERAAARAGLVTHQARAFPHFEDPDTIVWLDRGPLGPLRRWLRGRGDRPPINLRLLARSLIYLGPRALSHRFDTHIELLFRKPGPAGSAVGP